MIIGTGIDLVDSQRIQKLLDDHGTRFIDKYFTDNEKSYTLNLPKKNQALSLAKRFAAKEACAKAMGCGFREGIIMKDMEVSNNDLGKPFLTLHGKSLEYCNNLAPIGKEIRLHLSLTDEPPYAQAQLIIEAI